MATRTSLHDVPGELLPGGEIGPRRSFFGWRVPSGKPTAVLFLDENGGVAQDPDNFSYDRANRSLYVRARNAGVKKAIVGAELTDLNSNSQATIEARRVTKGAFLVGFGTGFVATVGEKGGKWFQAGAALWERDGASDKWKFSLRTNYQSNHDPVVEVNSRGDILWIPKPGSGAYGSALNLVASASVTSPLDGAIILDGSTVKYRAGGAWLSLGTSSLASPLTTKGDVWGFSTVDARIPVGSNGQVLTADSTVALGVKWATPSAGGKAKVHYDIWYYNNIGGTISDTCVKIGDTLHDAFDFALIMGAPGSFLTIYVKSNAARTAGSLTVEILKNGALTGLTATLDVTNTTFKATTQATGLDTFVAGDEITIAIDANGWTPNTADLRVGIIVDLD